MIDNLINLDRNVTIAINSLHSPFWDSIMLFLSDKYALIPLYALMLLYFVFRKRLRIGGREYYNSWLIVLVIILACFGAFAFADKFGHDVIKPYFQRLRPGYDFWTWDLVRTPDGKGGAYSFVSNHAFNIAGFATLTALFVRKGWCSILMFFLAAGVCYSRVYLARHFMGDVLCGAVLGIITGYIFYRLAVLLIRFFARHSLVWQCR